jgi:hypothetical protein
MALLTIWTRIRLKELTLGGFDEIAPEERVACMLEAINETSIDKRYPISEKIIGKIPKCPHRREEMLETVPRDWSLESWQINGGSIKNA